MIFKPLPTLPATCVPVPERVSLSSAWQLHTKKHPVLIHHWPSVRTKITAALQGTNISHQNGKRKIIFKSALVGGYVSFQEETTTKFDGQPSSSYSLWWAFQWSLAACEWCLAKRHPAPWHNLTSPRVQWFSFWYRGNMMCLCLEKWTRSIYYLPVRRHTKVQLCTLIHIILLGYRTNFVPSKVWGLSQFYKKIKRNPAQLLLKGWVTKVGLLLVNHIGSDCYLKLHPAINKQIFRK